MELYRMVDEILYYRWDPIGFGCALPRDEYHAYLPHTFSLLIAANSKPEYIADYLYEVETKHMGIFGSKEHDLKIANHLFIIKEQLMEKHDIG
jgi:hypothetical protein